MKFIVIARPPEDSEEIAEAVSAAGYTPLIEPVLSIERTIGFLPEADQQTPLIFTSANGVKSFADQSLLRDNPLYVVGRNTADEARNAGFTNIRMAAGTVDDLVDILLKDCAESKVLYVRAEDISKDLKSLLAAGGIHVNEYIAYRAVQAENLSIQLLKAIDAKQVEAILFFSVRGAQAFSNLIEQYDRASRMRTIRPLCISEAVIKSLSVLPFAQGLIAEKPDRYGMIKLLERLP